jgi:LPS O-antigen subunit length determinant protein (WzzB/FepE family)
MDFIEFAKAFGVPTAFLIAIGLAFWRASSWLATNAVTPIVTKYVLFVEEIARTDGRRVEALGLIAKTMGESEKVLQKILDNQTLIIELIKDSNKDHANLAAALNTMAQHLSKSA